MLALISSFPNLSSGEQRKSLLISLNAGGKLERAQSGPRSMSADQGKRKAMISKGSTAFTGKVAGSQTTGQPGHRTAPRSAAFGKEDVVVPLIHAFVVATEQSIQYRGKLNNHIT